MNARRTTTTLSVTLGLCTLSAVVSLTDPASAYTPMRIHSDAQPAAGSCSVNYGKITDTVAYSGGPVISNAQAVPVFWTTAVDPTVSAWAEGYLGTLVNSAYFDLLGQYGTAGQKGGTGQTVGRGTVVPAVTITPTTATGTSVTDKQIGAELQAQITAGHLPAPTKDAQGYTNTVYVLFFPKTISIRDPSGGTSCNQWCGYHGAYPASGAISFTYAVIPDMGSGSNCSTGCSDSCTTVDTDIMTGAVSHELAEAVSDPANTPGWVNPGQGNYEIGDICASGGGSQSDTGVVPGTNIKAQYEWSQLDHQCLLASPGEDAGTPPAVDAGSSSGAKDAGGSSGGKDAGGSGSGSSSGSTSGGSSGSSSGSSSGGTSSGGSSGSGGGSSSSSSGSSSGGTHGLDAGGSTQGDAGTANADAPGGQGGGCGCDVIGGTSDTGVGLTLLAGLFGLVAVRRERRRR